MGDNFQTWRDNNIYLVLTQLANTNQADIGQMPSNQYRHIGPMWVADLGPSGFAPRAYVDSTSALHRQTQQPSIGPMMGPCLAFLNRPDAGSTSACHRHTHQPSIGPMMGSCPLLHHWPNAGSTSANSSAQYRPDDGLMPCFASLAHCWIYIGNLTAQHRPNHESNSKRAL